MSARLRGVEALLFDLGGVVIRIDFEEVLRAWGEQSRLPAAELRRRFGMDEAYARHERGEIDAAAYFAHVRGRLGLQGSDASIAAGWNAVFTGEVAEAVRCIRSAAQRIPCFAFSNSNPTHQACWSAAYPHVVSLFRRVFVSSDLGMRKPERAAFEHVAAQMNVAPGAILFFDDTLENVHGARAAGLQSVHVRAPADLRAALEQIGVL